MSGREVIAEVVDEAIRSASIGKVASRIGKMTLQQGAITMLPCRFTQGSRQNRHKASKAITTAASIDQIRDHETGDSKVRKLNNPKETEIPSPD